MTEDNADQRGRKGKRDGRVAFLGLAASIQAGIDAGVPLVDVYAKHAGQLGFGYTQFTRYVNQHIRNKEKKRRAKLKASIDPPVAIAASPHADGAPPSSPREPIVTASARPKKFAFDPAGAHRKKLI